jgi:transcriptional regulator with XRE-family HTH domain
MKLRNWIKLSRMSIAKAAKVLKVDRTFVHYMLSGKRKPSKELLYRIREVTEGRVMTFNDLIDSKHADDSIKSCQKYDISFDLLDKQHEGDKPK